MPSEPASHPSIYRRFFTPAECASLQATPAADPSSEINLIRILLLRILEACSQAPALDLDTQAAVMFATSQAGLTVAGLVRLRNRLRHAGLDDPFDLRGSAVPGLPLPSSLERP